MNCSSVHGLLLLLQTSFLCATEYHVSTAGADANSESEDGPFGTIQPKAGSCGKRFREAMYLRRNALPWCTPK